MHKRHESLHVWKTSGGQPREVAMSVGMVMTGMRLAGVLIPVILLMIHVCGVVVLVEVGWRGMGEEHTMALSAHTVVNDHMHRRPEKGNHETQADKAHNHKAYLCDALPVKKIRGYSCLDIHTPCHYDRKMHTWTCRLWSVSRWKPLLLLQTMPGRFPSPRRTGDRHRHWSKRISSSCSTTCGTSAPVWKRSKPG